MKKKKMINKTLNTPILLNNWCVFRIQFYYIIIKEVKNIMKYEKIDKSFAYQRMYKLLKKEQPQKTEEFYTLMATQMTRDSIQFWLKKYTSDKIQKIYGWNSNIGDKEAAQLIDNLPEELYPNIEEWLNNEPISEIDYGGMSIKRIMEQHKESLDVIYPFLTCLKIMNKYIRNGCQDKSICYEPFIRVDLY